MYFRFSMFDQTVEIDTNKTSYLVSKNSKKSKKKLTEKILDSFYALLNNTGITVVVPNLVRDFGQFEEGDVWKMDYNDLHISGIKIENSAFKPYLGELIEGLDNLFGTSYVSPKRVEKLEISFYDNDTSAVHPSILQLGDVSHTEFISLDRHTYELVYAKRFPQACFHNEYKCNCENQVLQILDALPDFLQHFESREPDGSSPLVIFKVVFHDNSENIFFRNFNHGTGNQTMNSFLRAIREVVSKTVFQDGLLDIN